jgi:hypothetical protein
MISVRINTNFNFGLTDVSPHGIDDIEKMDIAEKNPHHMKVLVAQSEMPALRNHRDNTRSLADREGRKASLTRGSNRSGRVACVENKTPSARFGNSASVEKKTEAIGSPLAKR